MFAKDDLPDRVAEDDLLGRAVEGDREALERLFKRHAPGLRKRLAVPRRWRSVLSVDDVMQQTYSDAFLAIKDFKSKKESAFAKWLGVLAMNNLRDALKGLKTHKRGGTWQRIQAPEGRNSSVVLFETLMKTRDTPSRHMAEDEAVKALHHAMQRLSSIHHRVVKLYDLECRSVEEVATEIERSVGAVFMLRARALRQLRDFLGTVSNYFSETG